MYMRESYDDDHDDYWIDKTLNDYAKDAAYAFYNIIAQKDLAEAFANAVGFAYINDDKDAITIAEALHLDEGNFFALFNDRKNFIDYLLEQRSEAYS
jgi:hypothetical protein